MHLRSNVLADDPLFDPARGLYPDFGLIRLELPDGNFVIEELVNFF